MLVVDRVKSAIGERLGRIGNLHVQHSPRRQERPDAFECGHESGEVRQYVQGDDCVKRAFRSQEIGGQALVEEIVHDGEAHLFMDLLHVFRRVDPDAVVSLVPEAQHEGAVIAPDLEYPGPPVRRDHRRQRIRHGLQVQKVTLRGTGKMLVIPKQQLRVGNFLQLAKPAIQAYPDIQRQGVVGVGGGRESVDRRDPAEAEEIKGFVTPARKATDQLFHLASPSCESILISFE